MSSDMMDVCSIMHDRQLKTKDALLLGGMGSQKDRKVLRSHLL